MRALLVLLCLAACLSGCFGDAPSAGGSTETETGTAHLVGEVGWPDGRPAVGARLRLRPADYRAGETAVSGPGFSRDAETDAAGRFDIPRVPHGEYRLEALFTEGYGAMARFTILAGVRRQSLDTLVLRSLVSITGRVRFSDSSLAPATVHVPGTEHATSADSATGRFILPEMPPGVFDLRVSTSLPFFPAREFPGLVVAGTASVPAGDLLLEKGSKQGFAIADGRLTLAGIGGGNPVVYDNDFCTNTWDNEFLWALASLGRVDLRGNLATRIMRDSLSPLPEEFSDWAREAELCRTAGLRNIPEPMLGATRKLAAPPGGRWQDIVPETNPGILLLVSEARKASAAKPLIVVAGGPLTTEASALLLDPTIADRMVVFGVYNQDMNGRDSLASYVVARRGRFVAWGRDYRWSGPSPSRSPLPDNDLGRRISNSRDTTALPKDFFADFAALAWLADARCWRSAQGAKLVSAPLNASLGSDPPYDFIDIPAAANDWAAMDRIFFATFADSGAYGR